MNPGKLDRRLTILARNETRGTAGGLAIAYAEEDTVWAELVESGGQESRSSDALRGVVSATFRIRYRPSLTSQHRVIYDGLTYDILSKPIEEDRRRYQLLKCQSVEGRA